jgi:hypothetical protein
MKPGVVPGQFIADDAGCCFKCSDHFIGYCLVVLMKVVEGGAYNQLRLKCILDLDQVFQDLLPVYLINLFRLLE